MLINSNTVLICDLFAIVYTEIYVYVQKYFEIEKLHWQMTVDKLFLVKVSHKYWDKVKKKKAFRLPCSLLHQSLVILSYVYIIQYIFDA
jgi:hypothetical protein